VLRWRRLSAPGTLSPRAFVPGSDTGTIREFLSHTTGRITRRYADAAPSDLRATCEQIVREARAEDRLELALGRPFPDPPLTVGQGECEPRVPVGRRRERTRSGRGRTAPRSNGGG